MRLRRLSLSIVLWAQTACGPLVFEIATDAGTAPRDDAAQPDSSLDSGADGGDVAFPDAEMMNRDAEPADVPRELTVQVWTGDRAASGARIVFHDSAGRVLSTTITPARGLVSTPNADVAMVTLAERRERDGSYKLQTVFDVRRGETIHLSTTRDLAAPANHVLEVVPPGPFAGATKYQLDNGCGEDELADPNGLALVPIATSGLCVGTSSAVVALATAYDANDDLVGHTWTTGILSNTSTTALILPNWMMMQDNIEVAATRAPPGTLQLITTVDLLHSGLTLFGAETTVQATVGTSTTQMLFFPPLNLNRLLGVGVQFTDGSFSVLQEPLPRFGLDLRNIDLEAELLPPLRVTSLDWASASRPKLQWSTAREVASDAIFIALLTEGSHNEWLMLLPASRTSTTPAELMFPELPVELEQARPVQNDQPGMVFMLLDWDPVSGYEAVKQRARSMADTRPFRPRQDERFRASLFFGQ